MENIPIESGICPKCGAELEYDHYEFTDGGGYRGWICPECKAEGQEHVAEVFEGHTVSENADEVFYPEQRKEEFTESELLTFYSLLMNRSAFLEEKGNPSQKLRALRDKTGRVRQAMLQEPDDEDNDGSRDDEEDEVLLLTTG